MKRVVAFRAGRVPAARSSNHSAVIKTTDCRGRWPSDRRCPNKGVRRHMDPNKPSAPETVIRRSSCQSDNCRRSRTPGNNTAVDCPRCWSPSPDNYTGTTNRCSGFRNNCSTARGRWAAVPASKPRPTTAGCCECSHRHLQIKLWCCF
jgi:hypothetical protein